MISSQTTLFFIVVHIIIIVTITITITVIIIKIITVIIIAKRYTIGWDPLTDIFLPTLQSTLKRTNVEGAHEVDLQRRKANAPF